MKCSDYKLSTCRGQVFDRLCEIWKETKESTDPDTKEAWAKDIWRKANTLQAVAQYWHSAADATRKQRALALMREGYDFYLTKKAQEWWVDDFGWWGGFFGDLRDYTYAFPLDPPFSQANLLTEIEYCYDRMLVNLDAKQGGIWNQPGGEKNTITNDWALNLASNLFNITSNAKYKTFAENQYKWLMTGKYQGYSPQSWSLYTSTGLILWLPGPSDTPKSYWSGDEGVFLRGLAAYVGGVVTDPSVKKQLLQNCQNLIITAIGAQNGFPDAQSVMHESPNPPDWSNDLATGKGVFMRLVTRFAHLYNFFDDKVFETKFKTFVDLTAESVWCSRQIPKADESQWVIAPNWNPPLGPSEEGNPQSGGLWPQVFQTNGLDALNAAAQINGVA